jgi:tol-pal system protein YbgF
LDKEVGELADHEPILITPAVNGPSSAAEETHTEPPALEKSTTKQTIREQPPEPLPKKRADLVKKGPDSKPPAPESADPMAKDTYEKAYGAYQDGRFDEALALFKMFLDKHPSHDLSDNAQYWIGEIYYDIDNFPEAILAFKEVAARFPQENKAPHALLKIGYAYMALDDPANARTFFQRVIQNYPFSDAEAMARAKLKELESLPR